MGVIDFIFILYTSWGAYKGTERGIWSETVKAISLLIFLAFLLGFSLFSMVYSGLNVLVQGVATSAGFVTSLVAIVLSFVVVIAIRKRLERDRDRLKSYAEGSFKGGMIGGLRAVLTLVAVFLVLRILLPDFLHDLLFSDSITGSIFNTAASALGYLSGDE